MPDKQDQKKKEGGRKAKKNAAMHAHEHEIHAGQRHSAEPARNPDIEPDLATQPSGVGHHKRPENAGVVKPEGSKQDERDIRHSHMPHVPKR